MLGAHHVTRHTTPIHNILSTAPQFSIFQKALGTLSEDGNVMPKHVAARTKLKSVAFVRERTIPTERPPPVGEVSANFCGSRRGSRGQRNGSPRPLISVF